jgi:hypothetical protein
METENTLVKSATDMFWQLEEEDKNLHRLALHTYSCFLSKWRAGQKPSKKMLEGLKEALQYVRLNKTKLLAQQDGGKEVWGFLPSSDAEEKRYHAFIHDLKEIRSTDMESDVVRLADILRTHRKNNRWPQWGRQ